MIVHPNRSIEQSAWFTADTYPGSYFIDETTDEGKALAEKVQLYYPNFDPVIEDGRIVNVIQTMPVVTLEEAISQKLTELKDYETEGLKTFKSSALGTEHTYLSQIDDMMLLNGEYSYVKGDDYDGLPIMWYTIEAGNVEHNKEQFVQVYLDGRKNVQTVKYHRATLEAQLKTATTVDEVNAIVW